MFRMAARMLVKPRMVAFAAASAGVGGIALTMPAPLQERGRGAIRCHCQVPCGIFHDDGRIASILEDARTIRKAVSQAEALHASGKLQDLHQLIRWVNTKEEHATKIMTTVAEYFLAQKVQKEVFTDEHDYHEVL